MKAFRFLYFSSLMLVTFLAVTAIANAQPAVVADDNLVVVVDVDVCDAGGLDMCTDTGSLVTAAAGNSSVVAVIVQVKRNNGTPVAGLAEGDFSLNTVTNRAPAADPIFVSTAVCANCFWEPQPGVYRLGVQPAFGGIWGEGTYTTLLRVSSGNVTREVVIPIDIPG